MFSNREARRMVADTSQVLTEVFPEASPSFLLMCLTRINYEKKKNNTNNTKQYLLCLIFLRSYFEPKCRWLIYNIFNTN